MSVSSSVQKKTKDSKLKEEKDSSWSRDFLIITLLVVSIALAVHQSIKLRLLDEWKLSSQNEQKLSAKPIINQKPVAWVRAQNIEFGYLNNVMDVFQRIGYRVWRGLDAPPDEWDILWSHEYPFTERFNLSVIKPNQKVNHFPGSGYITNKVNLATSGLKHIPKAFNLPREKEDFLKFAQENPQKLWVQKDNSHRGIRVKSIKELDLNRSGTFVQEYIQNPFLINNKKFDIGLYVTMTSINPLRVYIFDNEALLRFCARPYPVPFNDSDVDAYVVGDDYTPIWDIPDLTKYYVDLGSNMKQALNAYIKNELGKDPSLIWSAMEESIKTIYYMKEQQMIPFTALYPDTRNFFEMVRFDFALDDQLNVYLMEANMSPNLASAKFPPNTLIYNQVLYSLFSLVGIVRHATLGTWYTKPRSQWDMMVLEDKDLSIIGDQCHKSPCHPWPVLEDNSGQQKQQPQINGSSIKQCELEDCDICLPCLNDRFRSILKDSILEEMNRWHNRRLIPSTSQESPITLGQNNYLQDKWFISKCIQDERWCN